MQDDLKYVIVRRFGVDVPILMSAVVDHCDVVSQTPSVTVAGAGFCRIRGNADGSVNVTCFGRSESLGRPTRGEADAQIIKREIELTWAAKS